MKQKILVAALAAGGMVTPLAHATNGMNLEGYGPVAASMGGASMAYDNGTAAVMNNPATLGLMKEGAQLDVAIGLLAPSISAKAGPMAADSSATAFYMPAMGYARRSGQWTYGAGVMSQGGMGTEYSANSFMAAGSGQTVRSEVGVGRVIVPLVYQATEDINIGGSVDFVWAGMDIKMAMPGASFMGMMPGTAQTYGSASGSMVNTLGGAMAGGMLNGVNWARVDFSNNDAFSGQAKGTGYAFKLGGTFKVSNSVTLGATYHSKTALGDLTSTGGASMSMNVVGPATGNVATTIPVTGSVAVHNFQWPETFGFGMAIQATDELLLVADYKRIGWKSVMKNFRMTFTSDAVQASPMAAAFGMGGKTVDMTLNQNWSDQNVFEFGASYKVSDAFTVRGGVNIANNPVPDMYMNPLFPAIGKSHETLGASYAFNQASSIHFDFAYMNKVTATNGQGVSVDFGGFSSQLVYGYKF
ncbi:outer membrane protein transport protein [Ferriphaselus sp. R-1]|uniref:OmpP1/FadL family transporter n=1 Tax=Ferriphaselus sp. R-1 TaxID=1485544 RepID=UPI000556A22F|nr:outer membrane protein transport protein [Ferriphaselus sp. R-1]